MAWFKLAKPAFIVGNFVRGFFHGSIDEVVETFTDSEVIRFKDTADLLGRCEPWERHLKGDAYDQINRALKEENYQKARATVDKYATQTADPSCITLLKMALVEVCTKCTTLIKEALPVGIVVPRS